VGQLSGISRNTSGNNSAATSSSVDKIDLESDNNAETQLELSSKVIDMLMKDLVLPNRSSESTGGSRFPDQQTSRPKRLTGRLFKSLSVSSRNLLAHNPFDSDSAASDDEKFEEYEVGVKDCTGAAVDSRTPASGSDQPAGAPSKRGVNTASLLPKFFKSKAPPKSSSDGDLKSCFKDSEPRIGKKLNSFGDLKYTTRRGSPANGDTNRNACGSFYPSRISGKKSREPSPPKQNTSLEQQPAVSAHSAPSPGYPQQQQQQQQQGELLSSEIAPTATTRFLLRSTRGSNNDLKSSRQSGGGGGGGGGGSSRRELMSSRNRSQSWRHESSNKNPRQESAPTHNQSRGRSETHQAPKGEDPRPRSTRRSGTSRGGNLNSSGHSAKSTRRRGSRSPKRNVDKPATQSDRQSRRRESHPPKRRESRPSGSTTRRSGGSSQDLNSSGHSAKSRARNSTRRNKPNSGPSRRSGSSNDLNTSGHQSRRRDSRSTERDPTRALQEEVFIL
jgi:hypothetical protein